MEALVEKAKEYKGPLLIFLGVLLLLLSLFFRESEAEDLNPDEVFSYEDYAEKIETQEVQEEENTEEEISQIVVDIKGAVTYPSVYYMKPGQRMVDLIQQAGGFTEDADDTQVNLAQLLVDQQMVYIPRLGEALVLEIGSGQSGQEGKGSLVNINTADEKELTTLNGIGEKKAQQIIAHREAEGSFKKIEDLMEVSGIGEKTFESLKDSVTVGP